MSEGAHIAADWGAVPIPWQRAFELAWEAFRAGTMAVGSVIVGPDGTIVAAGRNEISAERNGHLSGTRLAHAEVMALSRLPSTARYWDHTLYSTLEPCLLCFGATALSRVGRIRFAARDPHAGACSTSIDIPLLANKPLTVEGPLDGWLARLGAMLSVAHLLRTGREGTLLAESFGSATNDAARRLLDLPELLEDDLAAVIPTIAKIV